MIWRLMGGIEVLEEYPGRCLARWKNVLFMLGGAMSRPEDFDKVHFLLRDLLLDYPEGVALFRWVPMNAPRPTEAVRDRVGNMLASLGDKLLGFVAVLEGEGFWFSGARSVMTGINLQSGYAAPLKVFEDLDEGAQWLANRLDASTTLEHLQITLARLKLRTVGQEYATLTDSTPVSTSG